MKVTGKTSKKQPLYSFKDEYDMVKGQGQPDDPEEQNNHPDLAVRELMEKINQFQAG